MVIHASGDSAVSVPKRRVEMNGSLNPIRDFDELHSYTQPAQCGVLPPGSVPAMMNRNPAVPSIFVKTCHCRTRTPTRRRSLTPSLAMHGARRSQPVQPEFQMGSAFRPGDTGRIGPIVGIQSVLTLPGVGESVTVVGGFVAHAA